MKSLLATLLCLCSMLAIAQAPPALELTGSFEQGALIFGKTEAGVAVAVDGRALRVSPAHRFVFGLDRDAAAEVTLVLTPQGGAPTTLRYPVKKRSYDIQRLNGLPPKLVNPDPKMEARIAAESASNHAARARDTALDAVFEGFAWPAKGPITGVFGSQRIMNGEPKQAHYGVDIAGPIGAPAYAPADGVISLTNDDMFFSGGTLYIDHGYGVSSAFLHLSKILVKPGDVVKKGQKIALIGKTGRVTGPHLDWRVNWFEARVDAAQLVPAIRNQHTP